MPDSDRVRQYRDVWRRYARRHPRTWTPWLVIRYRDGDLGLRPLPDGEAFYLSPDVWIESSDPSGQAIAGQPNFVHAKIFNLGSAPGVPTRVDFYWADPSLGLGPANMNPIGTEWVEVDPLAARDVRCNTPWVPIFVNGGHECLKVNCSSPILDPITAPFEPTLDRHAAQRNITVLTTSAGRTLDFEVTLNNPWRLPGPTIVKARTERLALRVEAPVEDARELINAAVEFGQPQANTENEMRERYRRNTSEFRRTQRIADLISSGPLAGNRKYRSLPFVRVEGRHPVVSGELTNYTRTIEAPQADRDLGFLFVARDVLATPHGGPERFYNLVVENLTLHAFEQRRLLLGLDVPADCQTGELIVFHLAQVTHGLLTGGYSIVVRVL